MSGDSRRPRVVVTGVVLLMGLLAAIPASGQAIYETIQVFATLPACRSAA
jgi:hypothetical protein